MQIEETFKGGGGGVSGLPKGRKMILIHRYKNIARGTTDPGIASKT